MHHCPNCGHHHGNKNGWPRCMAITYNDHDAATRCGCTGHNRQEAA